MTDKKVILVLMDAFRSDYLSESNTPFLYKTSQDGSYYQEVTQSRSFCERSEIFTGLHPKDSGFFTAIGYDPKNSPYKSMRLLDYLYFFEKFIPKNKIYRGYKYFLDKYIRSKGIKMSSYSIPLNILKFFNLTEDKDDMTGPKAFGGLNNIFTECTKKGKSIYFNSFTALGFFGSENDQTRLKEVQDNIESGYSFYPIYFSATDMLGHKYGPDSKEMTEGLKKLDNELSLFCSNINLTNPEATIIFVGDHGMTPVEKTINIEELLYTYNKENDLRIGIDYIFFLDSTMLRVWYFNDKAKLKFESIFKNNSKLLSEGLFVNETLANEQKIPFGDSRYGDLIWLANTGNLIFPDFFHRTSIYKGMHGYDVKDKTSKGMCLIRNPSEIIKRDHINLTDIYEILRIELGLNSE